MKRSLVCLYGTASPAARRGAHVHVAFYAACPPARQAALRTATDTRSVPAAETPPHAHERDAALRPGAAGDRAAVPRLSCRQGKAHEREVGPPREAGGWPASAWHAPATVMRPEAAVAAPAIMAAALGCRLPWQRVQVAMPRRVSLTAGASESSSRSAPLCAVFCHPGCWNLSCAGSPRASLRPSGACYACRGRDVAPAGMRPGGGGGLGPGGPAHAAARHPTVDVKYIIRN